jgi:hypothetical protein
MVPPLPKMQDGRNGDKGRPMAQFGLGEGEQNRRLMDQREKQNKLELRKEEEGFAKGIRQQAEQIDGLRKRLDGKAKEAKDRIFGALGVEAKGGGGFRGDARRMPTAPTARCPSLPLFVVREYAHTRTDAARRVHRLHRDAAVAPRPRADGGKGEVNFTERLVTTYQVAIFGHTLDGRIGSATTTLEARLPFARSRRCRSKSTPVTPSSYPSAWPTTRPTRSTSA